ICDLPAFLTQTNRTVGFFSITISTFVQSTRRATRSSRTRAAMSSRPSSPRMPAARHCRGTSGWRSCPPLINRGAPAASARLGSGLWPSGCQFAPTLLRSVHGDGLDESFAASRAADLPAIGQQARGRSHGVLAHALVRADCRMLPAQRRAAVLAEGDGGDRTLPGRFVFPAVHLQLLDSMMIYIESTRRIDRRQYHLRHRYARHQRWALAIRAPISAAAGLAVRAAPMRVAEANPVQSP